MTSLEAETLSIAVIFSSCTELEVPSPVEVVIISSITIITSGSSAETVKLS